VRPHQSEVNQIFTIVQKSMRLYKKILFKKYSNIFRPNILLNILKYDLIRNQVFSIFNAYLFLRNIWRIFKKNISTTFFKSLIDLPRD